MKLSATISFPPISRRVVIERERLTMIATVGGIAKRTIVATVQKFRFDSAYPRKAENAKDQFELGNR